MMEQCLGRLAKRCLAALVGLVVLARAGQLGAQPPTDDGGNNAARLEWFRDQGFGLFIHWSVDSQLGTVISHSLVGASDDYVHRFFTELPLTFDPRRFDPEDWAVLAKLAGFRYVVFTAKHHSGFCMFDTKTTRFGIMHTPFHRDITAAVMRAFRQEGIAPGMYFSADDFWWLHQHGILIQREVPAVQPSHNPGLLAYDRAQLRELLTNYGPVDVLFFDGEPDGLRDLAWQLQPNVVVTRGAIPSPEQQVPDLPLKGAWESCLTIGTAWQYQPTLEHYKSGEECIQLLVETRAKGGNLLLDVGPKPDGELPIEEQQVLREIALWMFVNHECIYGVRPWVMTHEGNTWFTRKRGTDVLYAIVTDRNDWPYGTWRELVLKSVRATAETTASVLGQNGRVLEYHPGIIPQTTWRQEADGLHVRAMPAQRLRDNYQWPDPLVIKLTHVQPALQPPVVRTEAARADPGAGTLRCSGELDGLGDAPVIAVGFEYRAVTGADGRPVVEPWRSTPLQDRRSVGGFRATVAGVTGGRTYAVRAVAKHPLMTFHGGEVRVAVP